MADFEHRLHFDPNMIKFHNPVKKKERKKWKRIISESSRVWFSLHEEEKMKKR